MRKNCRFKQRIKIMQRENRNNEKIDHSVEWFDSRFIVGFNKTIQKAKIQINDWYFCERTNDSGWEIKGAVGNHFEIKYKTNRWRQVFDKRRRKTRRIKECQDRKSVV